MKGLNAILILLFLTLLSCKKEQPIIPTESPPPWKKFVGTYHVYDTTGVYMHDMEISHFFSGKNFANQDVDSLLVQNFNGMLDLRIERYQNTNPANLLPLGLYHGIEDHSGNRWVFSSWWDFPETPELENTLLNDTIVFGFKLNNMAYYIQDVTPYFNCTCRIVAVKQD